MGGPVKFMCTTLKEVTVTNGFGFATYYLRQLIPCRTDTQDRDPRKCLQKCTQGHAPGVFQTEVFKVPDSRVRS